MTVRLALVPLLLSGCQFLVCGDGTVESGGQCVAVTPADTAGGAPEVLSFMSNVTTLEAYDAVTFTAMVTHPGGVDQVIGGTLVSGSGAPYGAFATGADEGAYQMTVTWSQINQINPINLSTGVDGSRPFVATFYDEAGVATEARLDLGLSCDGLPSCEGQCGSSCGGSDTGG